MNVVSRHCFNSACLKAFYGKTLHCQTLLPPRGTVWIMHDLFFVMTIVRTQIEIRGSIKEKLGRLIMLLVLKYNQSCKKVYIKEKSTQSMSWFSHNCFLIIYLLLQLVIIWIRLSLVAMHFMIQMKIKV